jgi:hypothetical protein
MIVRLHRQSALLQAHAISAQILVRRLTDSGNSLIGPYGR